MKITTGPQIPVPEQIEVIKRIYDEFENGLSFNTIATNLNKNRITAPRGLVWRAKTIREILKNPFHAGIVVTGKTKRKNNPLSESFYTEKLPPEEWVWTPATELSPYRIIEPPRWAKIQCRINEIATKCKNRGKPPTMYGPSLLSGLLFCWHCGAPLVNGRGGENRYFRCSKRRLREGNPERCSVSFSIKENEFLPVFTNIIKDILTTMTFDSVRIFNEELKELHSKFSTIIISKKNDLIKNEQKEATLIAICEHAKKNDKIELFDEYCDKITELREKIISLKSEIEILENSDSISEKKLEIDESIFQKQIDKVEQLINNHEKPDVARNALKKLLPKIIIRSETVTDQINRIVFRIDELPPDLPSYLKETHDFLSRSKTQKKKIDLKKSNYVELNPIMKMYVYLSNTYVLDKLSYRPVDVLPMYWQLFEINTDNGVSYYYTLPTPVVNFGIGNSHILFGSKEEQCKRTYQK